jgi:hypothetical protein
MNQAATGIAESPRGLGKFFVSEFEVVTPQEAYDRLRNGISIKVPQAGAGSYRKFFEACGFVNVEAFETCSSAGDWSFLLQDGPDGMWYPAVQSNRYPYAGFEYSVNEHLFAPSREELLDLLKAHYGW